MKGWRKAVRMAATKGWKKVGWRAAMMEHCLADWKGG